MQVILNRPDDGLWHAKLGRSVLENLFLGRFDCKHQRSEALLTQMIIDEGHSYRLLNQPQQAISFFQKAQNTKAFQQKLEEWVPRLADKKMSAISLLPRFSITEIDNIADSALNLYENRADENVYPLFSISLHRIRIYMLRENFKKAKRLLNTELDRIDEYIPKIGIGNQIRLFLTTAQFYSLQNDIDGWKYFIDDAYQSASQGGFELQRAKIEAEMQRVNMNRR
jgi:tetratricopeptide (TPR) repeat protein